MGEYRERLEPGVKLNLNPEEVRAYLIQRAKQGKTCGYKELVEDLGHVFQAGNHVGSVVGGIGGEIAEKEHNAGRPLLSVLIQDQNTHLPGVGFFKIARKLGLFHGDVDSKADKHHYRDLEMARVFAYWSTKIDEHDLQEAARLSASYDSSSIPEEKETFVRQIERGTIGEKVKALNGYRCQICEAIRDNPFSFIKKDGTPYIEAHHVTPVSTRKKGVLSASNIITVCANHHRQMHYGNVEVQDYEDRFAFRIDGVVIEVKKVRIE